MSGVQLRFLGTGDAFGSGGRLHTSAHIRSAGGNLLVDCGPSTLAAMRRAALDPNAVDAIVLTHLHGDHFGGVPFLLMEAHYASGRARPLLIAGPAGVEAAVARAHEALFPGSGKLTPRFQVTYREWSDREAASAGPATVTPFPVRHSAVTPCYGLRIEVDGCVVAFSGDTEWTETLIALSAGADLFVCECFGFETAPPHHLDYRTLEAHRPALTCRRLLLTHMGPEMLARAAALGLDAADDGLAVTI
ncbi:MAG: MBL fold metallo-hydrolase [Vicinamibacterales bacterium]